MKNLIQLALTLSAVVLASQSAHAQFVGVGVAGGPTVYKNQKNEITPFPLIVYRDETFFIEGKTAGVNVWKQGEFMVSAIAEADLNKFDPKDAKTESFRQLNERKLGLLVGAQLAYRPTDNDVINFKVIGDATNTHKTVVPAVEWNHIFEISDYTMQYVVTAEARVTTSNYINYYYGVNEAESQRTGIARYRARNTPESELTLNFGVGYQATKTVKLYGSVGVRSIGTSLNTSPIVDRSTVPNAFVGVAYKFQ
jgi:MipA family protein